MRGPLAKDLAQFFRELHAAAIEQEDARGMRLTQRLQRLRQRRRKLRRAPAHEQVAQAYSPPCPRQPDAADLQRLRKRGVCRRIEQILLTQLYEKPLPAGMDALFPKDAHDGGLALVSRPFREALCGNAACAHPFRERFAKRLLLLQHRLPSFPYPDFT